VPSLALVVLDGWGLAPDGPGNAISQASTPVFDELWSRYPHTTLSASGRDVGLPEGQMGNSEVDHLNLGAGSVVKQDLTRIDDSIADGSFFENPVLKAACEAALNGPRGRLHLMGLVSDGGVHSGWEHIEACIELAAREGVPDLVVHAFTDGRDTQPRAGAGYIRELERWLRHAGRIATVSGRYFAMDRDRRWDRIKLAYDAVVHADGRHAATAVEAVERSYAEDETDEFIHPTVIGDYDGVAEGDAVLHFNFRPDRARQLVRALAEPGFDEFPRGTVPKVELTTLTELRKGRLVPSVRDVPTYDHKPEMSAHGAAASFREGWEDDGYRFAVINFANPDMVGHTGVIPAAVAAVETVDDCLGEVVSIVHRSGGACLVTADHGNADNMLEPDGSPNTAHSTNPVPLIATVAGLSLDGGGILADVAPTALSLLGIAQPPEMTGRSLIAA
jgi:2,3-bisphosphoglycerate-independent phosphoglycerate mutase